MRNKKYILFFIPIFVLHFCSPLFALPEIANIESGNVTFNQPDASTLNITADENAVINFQSFNISSNEKVNFIQPSINANVLSRVTGSSASEISGTLYANGNLFLINPNGIHFAATAQVNANTLIASALDIATNNFIAGNYNFERQSNSNRAYVQNDGTISANNVALIGGAVNNGGIIQAKAGIVHLASGDKMAVTVDRSGLIQVAVNEKTSTQIFDDKGNQIKNAVTNSGTIESGMVTMTAQTASDLFANAVSESGTVRATGIVEQNGVIKIVGDGDIQVGGTMETNAGNIEVNSTGTITVTEELNTTGDTTLSASNDINVNSDVTTTSGNLQLLADADLNGEGSFNQAQGTTISTKVFGDITIQSSADSTLANINSAGDLILKQAGAPAVFNQQPNSVINTKGSIKTEKGTTLNAADAQYNIGRDWIFRGTFVPDLSTVNFISPDPAQIIGNNLFYNFTVIMPGKLISFDTDSTQTIIGALIAKGEYGKLILLSSIDPTKQWKINPLGTTDIQYSLIANAYNIRGPPVKAIHSSSLGNNTNFDLDPYWTGQGLNNNWSNPNNWDTGTTPTAFDTVTFDGSAHGVIGANPQKDSVIDSDFQGTLANLFLDGYTGTLLLQRDLIFTETITLNSGTFDAGSQTITVSGDWANGDGGFIANASTVVFNDASKPSKVLGNNTFHNFSSFTPNKVIQFEAGKTQTILGTWTLRGAYATHVRLVSTSAPDRWFVDAQGPRDISYTWVEDSHNLDPVKIIMIESTNRGNSVNWDPTGTWTGATSANWATASNWSGLGGAAPGSGDDLVFPAGASNLSTSNNIAAATSFNSITIQASGYTLATNSITLAGPITYSAASGTSTISLAIATTAVRTITVDNSGATLVISSVISGAGGGLIKAGNGALTLSGSANTFDSGVSLNAGTLNINKAAALGTTAGTFVIASGTTIDNTSGGSITTSAYPQTWNGDFTFTGSSSLNFSTGAVALGANVQLTASANTLTIGGVISGAKSLTKAGSGTMTLSGANTFSGGMTMNAGTLNINNATALGDGAGTFTISGGTIDNTTGGTITLSNNNPQTWNGNFTFAGSRNLDLGTGAVTLSANTQMTASGAFSLTVGGGISGGYSLTKAGAGSGTIILSGIGSYTGGLTISAGTLTLSGANTFTGGVTLSGGTLNLNHATALGDASNTFTINGGTIDNTSGGITLTNNNPVTINANFAHTGSWNLNLGTGAITLGANIQITSNGNGDLNLQGAISGAYGITKAGTGDLSLSGANTFTGGVTLNAGGLGIDNATALGDSSGTFTINGGTILNFSGGSITLTNTNPQVWNSSFAFGGNSSSLNLGTGTVSMTTDVTITSATAFVLTVGGVISESGGSRVLTKAGAGTPLALSGANTFTGGVTLSAGTLNINSAAALGTGTFTMASGTTINNTSGSSVTLTTNNPMVWNGSFTFTGTSSLNLGTGAVTLGADVTITGSASTLTVGGIISGAQALTKAGAVGTLALSGANTFSNGITLSAGTLHINHATALGTGTLTISGGTIDNTSGASVTSSNNNVQSWGASFTFTGTNDLNLGTGAVTMSTNVTVTGNGSNLTIGGAIGESGGARLLTKAGANGTLTLSGANTFTGGMTLSAGTLNINHATALGNGAGTFTIGSGTIIDNTSGGAITLSNNNPMTWSGNFTFTGTNDLNLGTGNAALSASRTITVNGSNLTLGGVISESGGARSLTKAGNGTLTLSGLNTFTGGISISNGTLLLDLSTNTTGVLDATTVPTLIGGTLSVKGKSTGGSSQTLGNPAIGTGGQNTIIINDNGGTGTTLTLGNTWSRSSVRNVLHVDLSLAPSGALTSSPTLSNSVLGYATVKDSTGNIGFLTTSGGNVVRYTGATVLAAADNSSTTNYSTSGNLTMTNGNHATNTLSIDTSGGSGFLDLVSNSNVLSFGYAAILMTGSNNFTIQNAQVGASNAEFIVHQFGSGTLTISGLIGNYFAKAGPGALTLSAANTNTGPSALHDGTLNINNATALGTGSFTINGGTINNTSGAAITLTTNNTQAWSKDFTFTGTSDLNMGTGAVTPSNHVTITTTNGNLTVGGAISGSTLRITKAGAGTLTLSGASTFSGGMTLNAGTLNINNAAAVGTGTFTINGGTINNNSGSSITLSNNNVLALNSNFTFTGTGDLNLGTGTVTANADRTITVNGSNFTVGGIFSGPRNLTKAGAGTLTLSGVNTYTGTMTINAGTVSVAADSGLGTAPGGTVATQITFGGGTLGTTASFTLNSNRGITLNGGGGTIDVASSTTLTYGGIIAGTGALTKTSAGTLTLSGVNTYSGITTINAGTISIAADSGLGTAPGGATATQITFGGGTLATSASFTLNSNRGMTINAGGGTLDVAASTTLVYGGIAAGTGTLTKTSTGTLTLSGANTHSGGTTLSAGTLNINHATALGTGTFTIANGTTINNTSGGSITFSNNNAGTWNGSFTFTGSNALNFGSGAISLGASPTLTISASTLTMGGVISGAQSLTKAGSGTLTLSGANTFSSGTTLSAGTLNINHATALGTGTFTIANGTTFDNTSGGSITFSNNNAGTWNGSFTFTGSNALNFGNGAISLGASPTLTISASTLTLGGIISGAQSLTKAGAGTLTLSGANTFSSGTTLSAGTLNINHATAVGTGTLTIAAGTTIDNNSGGSVTLSNNNVQAWNGDFTFTGSNDLNLGSGAVTLSANRQVTVGGNTLTVGGAIGGGAFSLTKAGVGALTLSGTNTFTGGVNLNAGTLNINAASALGTIAGTFTIAAGTTIDNTSGGSITTVNYPQTWNGSFTFTGNNALNLGSGAVSLGASPTLTISGSTLTVGGIISGAQSLTKAGTGALTLSGTNTFTGGVTHNAGTLNINAAAALGTTAGTFTIANGTTIDNTSGGSITTSNYPQTWNGSFTFTGSNALNLGTGAVTLGASPTLTISTSTLTVGGIISGAQALTKAGNGTLTLSGVNTYSGITTINAGTLSIAADSGLGTAPGGATATSITFGGGTLATTASFTLNSNRGMTINAGGGTLDVSAGTTLVYGGITAGAGLLTKTSTGTLTLSGVNTHTGGVTLSAGTLNINNAAALGTTAGTFTIAGGTTIDNTSGGSITLTNNNPQAWNGDFTFTGSNALNLGTGAVTLSANRQVTVGGSTLTVGGVIGGAFSLTKAGVGALTLSGTNTFTGGVSLSAGTLNINNASALGTVAGTFTISGGTIDNTSGGSITTVNYPQAWNGNFTFTGSNALNLGTGAVTLSANRQVTVSASTLTVGGVIGGAFTLTKAGAGTLTLTGANTYTGATTISAGVLNIQNNSALGAGTVTVTVTSGAALQLQGGITVPSTISFTLNGTGVSTDGALRNISGNNTVAGAITLGSAGRIASDAGTLTLSGAINNAGFALTFSGAGDINFSGAISNDTTITKVGSGTLKRTTNALSLAGAFTVSAGTFDANGQTVTITGLTTVSGGIYLASSGAHTLTGGLSVSSGTFNAGSAAMTVPADINLTGGTLTVGTSTLALNGSAAQTITSSGNIFNAITITNASAGGVTFADRLQTATLTDITDGSTLKFAAASAGAPHTITTTLTLTGGATKITLAPQNAATTWYISPPAGATVTSVSVSYSTSDKTVLTITSTSGGNNVNWTFGSDDPQTITWTGAVSDDWDTAGNWDTFEVPSAVDTVIIPSTARQPKLTTTAALTQLTLSAVLDITSSTITVSGNITSTSGGSITGVNPTITVNGYIGTLDNPVTFSVSGMATLSVTKMQDNVSISVKGSGKYHFDNNIPGFVVVNKRFLNSAGQKNFRNTLKQLDSRGLYNLPLVPQLSPMYMGGLPGGIIKNGLLY